MYNLNSGFGQVIGQLPFLGSGKHFIVGDSSTANLDILKQLFGYDPDGTLRYFDDIDAAIGECTANAGDTILVMPGHSETVSAASGITADVAGVSIIGLGVGSDVPVISFGTATTASMDLTADNVKIKNIRGLAAIDGLTKPFLVTGDNCELDIVWWDASATVEAATVVRFDTANNGKLDLVYRGYTAGNAAVRVVAIDACSNISINIDAYGVVSVAWVNMVDSASSNVSVRGRMYTQGVTNFTRDVVDTVTGSTWDAVIFDASAGAQVAGGSGAALAVDDISAVASAIGTITNTAGTATIGAVLGDFANTTLVSKLNVPTADATSNVDVSDVVGNKTDAAIADTIEGAAASTQSLDALMKATLQRIGADSANNTAATSLVAANPNGSVLERLEYIQSVTDAGTPSIFVPGLGFRVTKTEDVNTAVSDDLFTVTGKVLITVWTGEVTNALGAAVTDYKLSLTTLNADLCAATNLATAADGYMFQLSGDAGTTILTGSSYAVSVTGSADTNGLGIANRIVGNAGGTETIKAVRTAGDASDAIVHTIFYLPLETSAAVVAAA